MVHAVLPQLLGMGWVSVVKMRVGLSGRHAVGLSGQDEGAGLSGRHGVGSVVGMG